MYLDILFLLIYLSKYSTEFRERIHVDLPTDYILRHLLSTFFDISKTI